MAHLSLRSNTKRISRTYWTEFLSWTISKNLENMQLAGFILDDGRNPEVPPETATPEEASPEYDMFKAAVIEFNDFFTQAISDFKSAQDSAPRGIQKGMRGRGLPAIGSGSMEGLLNAIMLFTPGWLMKYEIIVDRLAPIVQIARDVISVAGGIKEFIIGTDFQNAFLDYAWWDFFRLFPTSNITTVSDKLVLVKEAIENLSGGETDFTELLQAIEGAIQDLALQETEIKFGDNQSLKVKAQLLQY